MSEEYQRIELSGTARRRRWSSAARRNGVAPNLVYRWRRLLSEGGFTADRTKPPSATRKFASSKNGFASRA